MLPRQTQFPLVSLEERGGRVGNQRLSHVLLGSIESLQQRILPKCKRCFCPKSWCVKSEQGQIKVLRWLFNTTSLRARWLCPLLHDILEQLEGPHDVIILGRVQRGKKVWLEVSEALF